MIDGKVAVAVVGCGGMGGGHAVAIATGSGQAQHERTDGLRGHDGEFLLSALRGFQVRTTFFLMCCSFYYNGKVKETQRRCEIFSPAMRKMGATGKISVFEGSNAVRRV